MAHCLQRLSWFTSARPAVLEPSGSRVITSVGGSMSISGMIKSGWTSGLVLSASVAFAQTPSPSTPQTPSSQTPSTETPSSQTPSTSSPATTAQSGSTYGSPVTVTGCVQQATGSSAGAGGGYVLRNSSGRGSSSSSSTASSSTTTSPSASAAGQDVQLMAGSSSVQLADHVGHQVEVTGTYGSPSASPTSGTTTGTTGSPSGTGTSSASPGRPGSTQPGQSTSPSASNMTTGTSFNVTSVRMLSASCPQ